jgi:hypothetical protein
VGCDCIGADVALTHEPLGEVTLDERGDVVALLDGLEVTLPADEVRNRKLARWPHRELATSCESWRNVSAVDLLRPRSAVTPIQSRLHLDDSAIGYRWVVRILLAQGDVSKVSLILLAGSMPDGSHHLW